MYDTDDEDGPSSRGGGRAGQTGRACPHPVPPLRLAGIDEDDTFEPHLVRGID
ncbi:hypothetical protein [Streptomyces sp. NPDC006997]|uniref:hypothetical protein n=1 Tax=Streptomyces sp. NPDC006997 TaxID=3155356 RepID=UPI0033EAB638